MSNEMIPHSDCFRIGLQGNCGINCPVFQNGECEVEDEASFIEELEAFGDEAEKQRLYNLYPQLK